MAAEIETKTFSTLTGSRCTEVRTGSLPAQTLVYIDIEEGGSTFQATLFNNYRCTSRVAHRKTVAGILSVVNKHLASEGFETISEKELP